ncbi:trypsin-like peptidase domain-containing protein [Candidatus Uabimicrobium amorphum]|uniref:Serine endoprotease DegQ n=1 Tax=Uabimicrobium amorphum TaxID=2596890 RepID=A0A5S9F360_UABAM|nr:trypsin-like peptidase domain-containing protein [Candidatus Uabimicrobium amorphum]BBM84336.1 serine endoprotease DegQ [Candidatus Uabimicrobium amorphum]
MVKFAMLVLSLFVITCYAQDTSPQQPQPQQKQHSQLQKVINKALQSYVFVDASGSGVVISEDGYVITNDHVAGDAATWRIRTADGTMHYADLVGTDPYGDISLLKIRDAKGLPFIELGDSDILKTGQQVIAIGNPFGMGNLDEKPTVTVGIISALHRFHFNYTDAIMTDAPLNPGNSGGPLITMDGKLVGINGQIDNRFQIRVSSGIGYAVSSNQIRAFLPHLKAAKGGFVYHGHLTGVRFPRISDEEKKPFVLHATRTSGLYVAGIRKGDLITHINDKPIKTVSRLIGLVRSYPSYTSLKFTVLRKEEQKTYRAMLDVYRIRGRAQLEVTFYPSQVFARKQAKTLLVANVQPDTPAAKAGVLADDIIVSFAGKQITPRLIQRFPNYLNVLFSLYASPRNKGALVELTVIRDGVEKVLVITIEENSKAFGVELKKTPSVTQIKKDNNELKILKVQEGMLADRGGLKRGDVLLEINKFKLRNKKSFYLVLNRYRPGEKVKIKVLRDGKTQTLDITLGLQRNNGGGF